MAIAIIGQAASSLGIGPSGNIIEIAIRIIHANIAWADGLDYQSLKFDRKCVEFGKWVEIK